MKNVRDGLKRAVVAVWLLAGVAACAQPAKGNAGGDNMAAVSAAIVAWGQSINSSYAQAMGASRVPVAGVPVPPQIDVPCTQCGQQTVVLTGQQQVDAWVNQSLQPEDRYMTTLMAIWKKAEANQELDINQLTPTAQAVVYQYNPALIREGINRLAKNLVEGKAIPMAKQYMNDPRRAYPGILFLLAVTKRATLMDVDAAGVQQCLDLATQWQKTVVDRIDRDIREGHQYNLCPSYLVLLRQLALLGAEVPGFTEAELKEKVKEWQKLLYFDVVLNLHVKGQSAKGSMNADWEGKARLRVTLDEMGTCYKPEMVNGGAMEMSMNSYDFVWTQHDQDGDVEIHYKGPNSFKLPMTLIQLDLCDPQPVLQLPLAGNNPPVETYEGKGKTFQNALFGGFMGMVVQANHTNTVTTNRATGKSYPNSPAGAQTTLGTGSAGSSGAASNGAGQGNGMSQVAGAGDVSNQAGAPPAQPANGASGSNSGATGQDVEAMNPADVADQIRDLQTEINSHLGDTAWVQSEEGRATLAKYRNLVRAAKKWGDENGGNRSSGNSAQSGSNSNSQGLFAGDPQVQSLRAQINAHKGDAGWMMSAEGKAAIDKLQQLTQAKLAAKLADKGIVVPKEGNLLSLASAVMSTQLTWTNGQAVPVNQTLKAQKDGNLIELKVKVTQAPE